jgi:hypothetical protein
MNKEEIQKQIKDLEHIMSKYKQDLGLLEKELFETIYEYNKALEKEKANSNI